MPLKEPVNYKNVRLTNFSLFSLLNVCYYNAKITALDNWKQRNVYREVPYHGQHLISIRWVCSLKETNASFVPKAQLVAKGFEDNKKKTKKLPFIILAKKFKTNTLQDHKNL